MSETPSNTPSSTAMKPETAAKKLGIYLPAAPQEFQDGAVTHAQLRELQMNPPQWLSSLRADGPHPVTQDRHEELVAQLEARRDAAPGA